MKAYELIDKPEKWTKGAFARDANGYRATTNFKEAVCYCIHGALGVAYDGIYTAEAERIRRRLGLTNLVGWNDAPERTWQEVYNLLKELDI